MSTVVVCPCLQPLLPNDMPADSRPLAEQATACAARRQVRRGAWLRGLRIHAQKMWNLRCSSLRSSGLRRGVAAWKKKAPADRQQEYRRRYLAQQLNVLECRVDDRVRKSAAIWRLIANGDSVHLLESREQPPPASDKAPTDVNVSDPPVGAAKRYFLAVERYDEAKIRALDNHRIVKADRELLSAVAKECERLMADRSVGVDEYRTAKARRVTAYERLSLSIPIAEATQEDADRLQAEAQAAFDEWDYVPNAPRRSAGDDSADATKEAADRAIKQYNADKTAVAECTAGQLQHAVRQGMVTSKIMDALAERDRQQADMVRTVLAVADLLANGENQEGAEESCNVLQACKDEMQQLRKRKSMPVLAAAALRGGNMTPETVLAWFNQYDTLGYCKLDQRGSGTKEWILSEDDLLTPCWRT